jgi:RNA polymerase sigma-70 factor (ECF subfamily)
MLPVATDSTLSTNLLLSLKGGDGDAWGRLVRLYGPLVYGWCRHRGLQDADAEEIGQHIFLDVLRAIPNFQRKRPGDSFRAWFWTVAGRRLTDFRRRQARLLAAQGGGDAQQGHAQPPAEETPPPTEGKADTGELLRRALALIQGKFESSTWQAFWLVTVEGRDPAGVAADLNISRNAVYVARSRVLAYLRAEFGALID